MATKTDEQSNLIIKCSEWAIKNSEVANHFYIKNGGYSELIRW